MIDDTLTSTVLVVSLLDDLGEDHLATALTDPAELAKIRNALKAVPSVEDKAHAKAVYGRWGAHRAYVIINGLVVGGRVDCSARAYAAAFRLLDQAGVKVVRAHGCGGSKAIYLGHDNCQDGIYAASGAAIVRALAAVGIAGSVDAAQD